MAIKELERGKRYRIYWRDEHRRQRQETVGCSRTEAKDRLAAKVVAAKRVKADLRRLANGMVPRRADSIPTFYDFVEERFYRDYHGRSGVRSTYYQDAFREDGPIMAALRELRIDRITPEVLGNFRRQREAEGRSPSTVRKNLTAIGTVLGFAVDCGLLPFSPMARVKKPAEPKHRAMYLTDEELERLQAELRPWVRRLATFAAETGLRLGEVRRLRWSDFDLANGYVYVPEDGKTGTRPVPLSREAAGVVEGVRQERRVRSLEAGRIEPASAFVFTGPDDAELTRANEGRVGQSIQRALQRMGIEVPPRRGGLRLMRHTFASRLLQRGVGLAHVQDLLGHSDPKLTRRYAHLSPRDLRAAVATLDRPAPEMLAKVLASGVDGGAEGS